MGLGALPGGGGNFNHFICKNTKTFLIEVDNIFVCICQFWPVVGRDVFHTILDYSAATYLTYFFISLPLHMTAAAGFQRLLSLFAGKYCTRSTSVTCNNFKFRILVQDQSFEQGRTKSDLLGCRQSFLLRPPGLPCLWTACPSSKCSRIFFRHCNPQRHHGHRRQNGRFVCART